ncbi:hypothetical protein DUNSADRAFT_14093 [Dunaliella salina]|uniref:Calcium/calmodulin-dependent protein kinase II association-domain domain-containing protein n=1 Tax=Dunaliella salina TaxID=3046 RepID=A0ABQ7G833_DUNSA|nr:hypothetical protein DUNSADRAFT_14093 [Dunaliella salina]|eukprot:KAF5830752.1 hypothetical protein DUNSADRAFT_14093 [Dunaliella salina]
MALLLSKRHLASKQASSTAAAPSKYLVGPVLCKSAIVPPAVTPNSMSKTAEEVYKPIFLQNSQGDSPPQRPVRIDVGNVTLYVGNDGIPLSPDGVNGASKVLAAENHTLMPTFYAGWAKNTRTEFGNAKDVIECFAQDAAVLPTLSDELKTGHDNIRDYFDRSQGKGTSFLARNPVGKIVPGQRVIKMIGTDVAIDQGLYVFQVDNSTELEASKRERVKSLARFTFLYKKQKDGNWKIANFHSSQQPDYVAERGLVVQHLHRWFDALYDKEVLAGGDTLTNVEARAQRTADLYAPDAVLLATVSPLVRVGRKDIVDYMRFFVSLNPRGQVLKDEKGQDILDVKLLSCWGCEDKHAANKSKLP